MRKPSRLSAILILAVAILAVTSVTLATILFSLPVGFNCRIVAVAGVIFVDDADKPITSYNFGDFTDKTTKVLTGTGQFPDQCKIINNGTGGSEDIFWSTDLSSSIWNLTVYNNDTGVVWASGSSLTLATHNSEYHLQIFLTPKQLTVASYSFTITFTVGN